MGGYCLTFTTVPSREAGMAIADSLVEDGCAACVNVVPSVTSVYRWKGRICREEELLLLIKTRIELKDRLTERIIALHPYEVPEIISLEIHSGSEPYLAWIHESTGMP